MNYMETLLRNYPRIFDVRKDLPTGPGEWKKRDPEKIEGMVWHQALGWGTVEDVARYHSGPNHLSEEGLPGIAYTFAIRRSGDILLCNDLAAKPWSQGTRNRAGDENAEFMSCLFEGRFWGRDVNDPNVGEPTIEQIESGLYLWKLVRDTYGWPFDALYGHSNFGKPACPGYTLQRIIDAIARSEPKPNSEQVRGVQQQLQQLGFYLSTIDGLWGPLSQQALIAFQIDQKIETTGILNMATRGLLTHAAGFNHVDNR